MNDLMDKMGLTVEEDIEDLKRLRRAKRLHVCDIYIKDDNGKLKINKNSNDFIEVDDNPTQLKALELTLKLKGHLKEKDRGNVIQQTFVGADIVEKIKKLEVTQVRTQVKTEV